jgi:hypothetical protein
LRNSARQTGTYRQLCPMFPRKSEENFRLLEFK